MQAKFTLADGGLTGQGLGQSESKWSYLPNAYNDFIFAIIGEELGLIGCVTVVVLFAALAFVGLRIAARWVDPFLRLLAAVSTTWICGQAVIKYQLRRRPVACDRTPAFPDFVWRDVEHVNFADVRVARQRCPPRARGYRLGACTAHFPPCRASPTSTPRAARRPAQSPSTRPLRCPHVAPVDLIRTHAAGIRHVVSRESASHGS